MPDISLGPSMPRRRRRHPNWPARFILLGLAVVSIAYLLVPAMQEYQDFERLGLQPRFSQLVTQQSARLFGVAWFCFLGASIGSFLNVVVWRVPRGRSLLGRSHCPWCACQIKSYDNLPVLGWVLLRGRCRACHLPISARYPIVELWMAVVVLLLLAVELLSGGANLPIESLTTRRGILELVFTPHRELLGLFAFHAWMMFHLTAWFLIRWDGLAVPKRYIAFCLLTAIVGGVAFPWLHPVSARAAQFSFASVPSWFDQGLTGLIGATMGALLGNEFDMAWIRQRPQATAVLALIGAHLGWQAAFGVAFATTFIQVWAVLWRRLFPVRQPWPLELFLSLGALLQLVFWKQTAEQLPWWPGPNTALHHIALAGLGVVVFQFVIRRASGRPRMEGDSHSPSELKADLQADLPEAGGD